MDLSTQNWEGGGNQWLEQSTRGEGLGRRLEGGHDCKHNRKSFKGSGKREPKSNWHLYKTTLASEWREGWEGTRVEQGQESGDPSEQSGMEWSGGEVIWEYNL